jgi:hypothetical protein
MTDILCEKCDHGPYDHRAARCRVAGCQCKGGYTPRHQPMRHELWKAVLAGCDAIEKEHGRMSRRSTAQWSGGEHHIRCSTVLHTDNGDGSDSVWIVEAFNPSWWSKRSAPQVEVQGPFQDNKDGFWKSYAEEAKAAEREREVIVGGYHYMIGDATLHGEMAGFGGRKFEVFFTDGPNAGKTVVTHNMWFQGRIPPKWREALPDNAEFIGPNKGFSA